MVNNLYPQVIHTLYFDRFTHYEGDDWVTYAPASYITSIDIGDDYVYFGTESGGILRYHLYDRFWDYPFTTSNGLSDNRIIRLTFNPDDRRLYARTASGLDYYDRGFEYWRPAQEFLLTGSRKPDPVELSNFHKQGDFRFPSYYRPSIDELPNFFMDTDYIYQPDGTIFDKHNRSFSITSRMVDPWNKLWFGTDGLGIGVADLDNIDIKMIPRSLPYIRPRDVLVEHNNLWIGGISHLNLPAGITRWNTKSDSWSYFEDPYNYDIYNDDVRVIEKSGKTVFFGTELGLVLYNKAKRHWKSFTIRHGLESNLIYDLFTHSNELFIATDEGMNWYDPSIERVNESADTRLDNVPVNMIDALDDSTLVLATRNGLYNYHIQLDRFSVFQTGSALLDVRVSAVAVHDNRLWISNEYGISYQEIESGDWKSFTGLSNQADVSSRDIAFTENVVWFATRSGLLKYDFERDYWYLYTTKDGLVHNDIYHIDIDGDFMWLSTAAGLTSFRWWSPDRLE